MSYDPLVDMGIESPAPTAPGQGTATQDSGAAANSAAPVEWRTNPTDPKWKQILDVLFHSPDAKYLQRATVAGATGGLGMGPLAPVGAILAIMSEDPNFAAGQGAINKIASKVLKAGQFSSLSRAGRSTLGAGLGVAQTALGAGAAKALDLIPGNPLTPTGNVPPRMPSGAELGFSALIPGLAEARAGLKARKPAFQLTKKITNATEEAVGEPIPLSIGWEEQQPISTKVAAAKNRMLTEMRAAGTKLKAEDIRPELRTKLETLKKVEVPAAELVAKQTDTDLKKYQANYNDVFRGLRAADKTATRETIADVTTDLNDRIAGVRQELANLKAGAGKSVALESSNIGAEVYDETKQLQSLAVRKEQLITELAQKPSEERIAAIRTELRQIAEEFAGAKYEPTLTKTGAASEAAFEKSGRIGSEAELRSELLRLQTEKQNILTDLRARGVTDPERLALPEPARRAQDELAAAQQGHDHALANTYRVQQETIDTERQLLLRENMMNALPEDVQRDMAAAIGSIGQTAPEIFEAAWGKALRGNGDLSVVPRRVDELISTLSRAGYPDAAKDVRLTFMHDLLSASRDGAGYPTKLYGIIDRMGTETARDFFPKLFQAPNQKPGDAVRMADSFLHAAGELASLSNGRPAAKGIHISNGFLVYEALKPIVGAGKASAVALFTFGILKQVAIGDLLKKAVEDPIAVDTFLRYTNKYGLVEGLRKSRVANAVFRQLEGQVYPVKEARWKEVQEQEAKRLPRDAGGAGNLDDLLDSLSSRPAPAPERPKFGEGPPR